MRLESRRPDLAFLCAFAVVIIHRRAQVDERHSNVDLHTPQNRTLKYCALSGQPNTQRS